MDKKQPINFIGNQFIYLGGLRERFNGEKEYTTLPHREKFKVNNQNIWNSIKEIFIPISQMAASISGSQYCNTISKEDKIGYYDIETDDRENFILGYINESKFTDPKKMVESMKEYEILVSFNGFRFDNEVLHRYCPEAFIETKNKNFIAHTINGSVMIDLFSVIGVIVGLESYSAEALARYKGFNKKIPPHGEKDEKCRMDIEINRFLFEKYNIIKVFNTLSSLINTDLTLMQIIPKERLRKWILINKYLKSGFLPLKTDKARYSKAEFGIMRMAKPGFYRNYRYLDIVSTYPQTAVNLGNLGIYDNDNMFSELQKDLLELSSDKDIKPYMKSIANSLCGAQYSLKEYWRNDDIFEKIVTTVADKVREAGKKRKDIIYINTDCFVIPKGSENIKIEGYEVKEDYDFRELYIYNGNKWIGRTKKGIEYRGFKRISSRIPKILQIAREEILERLKKKKGDEFKEALEEPEKLVGKTIRNLKKFDKSCFKFIIRKKDDFCWDVSLMDIWKDLQVGFNEVYYKNYQKHTINEKEINYKYYKEMILELAREYQPSKE